MLNGNTNYRSKCTYISGKSTENTTENIKNPTTTATESTKTRNTTRFFVRLTTI